MGRERRKGWGGEGRRNEGRGGKGEGKRGRIDGIE